MNMTNEEISNIIYTPDDVLYKMILERIIWPDEEYNYECPGYCNGDMRIPYNEAVEEFKAMGKSGALMLSALEKAWEDRK